MFPSDDRDDKDRASQDQAFCLPVYKHDCGNIAYYETLLHHRHLLPKEMLSECLEELRDLRPRRAHMERRLRYDRNDQERRDLTPTDKDIAQVVGAHVAECIAEAKEGLGKLRLSAPEPSKKSWMDTTMRALAPKNSGRG